MKVHELISALEKLDQDEEVCYQDARKPVIIEDEYADMLITCIRKVKNFDDVEEYYLIL